MVHPPEFYWPVVSQQFLELGLLYIGIYAGTTSPALSVNSTGPIPIALRKVKGQLDPILIT